MQRNEFLDFAKGVLITLVTIGHAIQYVVYRGVDFWGDPLFKSIYMFHMPLFMAISGYLSYAGLQNVSNLPAFFSRRSLSYLVPIVSWAVVFQVSLFAFSEQAPPLQDLPLAIGRESIWSQWFLWALLGSIAVTVIAAQFRKYAWAAAATIFCGFMALPDLGNVYLFKYTFPFFVAGYFAARYPAAFVAASKSSILLVIGVAVMSLGFQLWDKQTYIYVTKMSLDGDNANNIALRWIVGALGSLVALGIIRRIHSSIPRRWARPVELAGKDSLYIYILQGYVFLVLPQLIDVGPAGTFAGALWAVFIGILVAWGCRTLGSLIAANRYTAIILFGRAARPNPSSPRAALAAAEREALSLR
jgi:fucose 4-O-acetylase-like acetyltransferase